MWGRRYWVRFSTGNKYSSIQNISPKRAETFYTKDTITKWRGISYLPVCQYVQLQATACKITDMGRETAT
jgi:hypothetical protein